MSLGWKKFSFFEKEAQQEHVLPEDLVCTCSSAAQLFCGTASGKIVVVERGLERQQSFHAHQQAVSFLDYLQDHKLLLSLGRDDATVNATVSIKVWNLEAWAETGKTPPLLRTIDCFGGKSPEADVSQFAVHEGTWPLITYAVGLANGHLYVLHADSGNGKVQKTHLSARPAGSDIWQITGMGFRVEDSSLMLFVVTKSQTLCFDVKTSNKTILDEMGADFGCTALNHERELVVARPEAVYLYSPDGRGPCFVFDGTKQQVGWVKHYLVAVTKGQASSLSTAGPLLQIYDLRNKLIAASVPLKEEPRHVVCAWNTVLVLQAEGELLCLKEKALSLKLELLFSKSLYLVALNLAHSEQAEDSVVAEIQRRYADHLYAKHDYDAAMTQYLATIGHLEASFVIRKFLDAQRIPNLTSYLEALHAQGLASSDHTTLLLNCYTKLKDVEKLDEFLRGSGAAEDEPSLRFDVETAIKVCRAAGYFEHALFVAQAAQQPQMYLDILLEDCHSYDEALAYLQDLPRQEAAAALQKYGKVLVTHRPESTTALLMQLCTAGDPTKPDGDWVAKAASFTHLYDERPQALMLLCEYILNSTLSPPSEEVLYHTLLQLYLAEDIPEETESEEAVPSTSQAARRDQALELLKHGWQPGDEPRYNPDEALVVCRMHSFRPGLIFLYEHMRLFREVLKVHMAAGDHIGLIEACMRLGDAARGGDPQLWTDVLDYLTKQPTDCTQQVQEVLGHIEAGGLLPPLVVLQTLAQNPRLKLSLVKEYIARQLRSESAHIEEDRRQIAKYEEETHAMREQVHELKSQARVFQNSKCAVSGSPLELPAVHFLCGHSCNLRSLGENERECPLCAPQFRTILDIRRSLRAGASEQDKFFTQLRNSADGFNVIAEFFGRGLLNNAHARRSDL